LKSQKEAGGQTPHPVVIKQLGGTAASISKLARPAQSSFDDLHARITTRAYDLYVQRGTEKVVPWEIGWMRNRKM